VRVGERPAKHNVVRLDSERVFDVPFDLAFPPIKREPTNCKWLHVATGRAIDGRNSRSNRVSVEMHAYSLEIKSSLR
jgi:hypothetical protein